MIIKNIFQKKDGNAEKVKIFSTDKLAYQSSVRSDAKSLFKTLKEFRDIKKTVEMTESSAITTVEQAKIAWKVEDENAAARKYTVTGNIFLGLWMLAIVYLSVSIYMTNGQVGILPLIQHGMVIFMLLALAVFNFWQAQVMNNGQKSFYQYVKSGKWLFSLIIICFYAAMMQNGQTMAAAMDLPDFEVKLSTDITSRYIGMIVGTPWADHGGTALASGVPTILLPVLTVVNTAALSFVSVFCVYIYAFGIVQIAHSGSWNDSPIFSTFWSPIRTTAALALCAPMANGISFLQHIVLIAIAMSINWANNLTQVFVDQVNETSGLTVSSSIGPVVEENFGKIFNALSTGMTIQYASMNIFGINLKNNEFYSTSTKESGGATVITIQMTAPDRISSSNMPKITIKAGSPEIATAYLSATAAIVNAMSTPISSFLAADVSKRGDAAAIKGALAAAHKAFSQELVKGYKQIIDSNPENKFLKTTLKNVGEQAKTYGWAISGAYPFIIAMAQNYGQNLLVASTEISSGDISAAILGISSVSTPEISLVKSLQDALQADIRTTIQAGAYAGMADAGIEHPASFSGIASILDVISDSVEKDLPNRFVEELKSSNSMAVLFSFGSKLVTMCAAIITALGALQGGADAAQAAASGSSDFIAKLLTLPTFGASLAASGALQTAMGAAVGAMKIWIPIFAVFCSAGMLFGAACCYILPSIAVIFWCRALVSWALMTLETLVGAAFWAAAHVLPEGQGLAGQHARRGYLMLLDLFLRPLLLVLGVVMSILACQAFCQILAEILGIYATVTNQVAGYWLLGVVVTFSISIYIMYTSMKFLFIQGIGTFPEKVIMWCGGVASDSGVSDAAAQVAHVSDAVSGAGGKDAMKNLGKGAAKQIGGMNLNKGGGTKPNNTFEKGM